LEDAASSKNRAALRRSVLASFMTCQRHLNRTVPYKSFDKRPVPKLRWIFTSACGRGMSDAQQPTAEQYRKTAEEIRRAAQHIRSPEIRGQMLDLSERYERLAAHAGRRGFWRGPA
jgi:hypothetical protein